MLLNPAGASIGVESAEFLHLKMSAQADSKTPNKEKPRIGVFNPSASACQN
jgi:hypothetical protein